MYKPLYEKYGSVVRDTDGIMYVHVFDPDEVEAVLRSEDLKGSPHGGVVDVKAASVHYSEMQKTGEYNQ